MSKQSIPLRDRFENLILQTQACQQGPNRFQGHCPRTRTAPQVSFDPGRRQNSDQVSRRLRNLSDTGSTGLENGRPFRGRRGRRDAWYKKQFGAKARGPALQNR